MNIGERLYNLRKDKGLTQEELAEYLSVSRQSVSKWEQNVAIPETEKLIKLARLYEVSLDSLINPDYEEKPKVVITNTTNYRPLHYEYKSKKMIYGRPLVHINIGRGFYIAKGIIAIGNISFGVISLGLFSLGLISLGVLGFGLIGLGAIALGLLIAVGSIAIGTIAIGAIAIGLFTIGAISVGYFSYGALSIAKYIAIGDHAKGLIAIGKTASQGNYTFNNSVSKTEVSQLIDQNVPAFWRIFIIWIKQFI